MVKEGNFKMDIIFLCFIKITLSEKFSAKTIKIDNDKNFKNIHRRKIILIKTSSAEDGFK
jgi:hypothetical protein